MSENTLVTIQLGTLAGVIIFIITMVWKASRAQTTLESRVGSLEDFRQRIGAEVQENGDCIKANTADIAKSQTQYMVIDTKLKTIELGIEEIKVQIKELSNSQVLIQKIGEKLDKLK